jgi:hypothetical protein
MTHRRRYLLPALLFVASMLATVSVRAQLVLQSQVVGSGGTLSTDGSLVLAGTAGQALIGPVSNGSNTAWQGFWYTLPQRTTVSVPEERTGGSASAVALHQNVPNPFSTTTDIQVDLPTGGHVSVKVFDAIGHEVMTLIDGPRAAGSLVLHVDGANLESGQYTTRLVANGTTRTIRMIVVK